MFHLTLQLKKSDAEEGKMSKIIHKQYIFI